MFSQVGIELVRAERTPGGYIRSYLFMLIKRLQRHFQISSLFLLLITALLAGCQGNVPLVIVVSSESTLSPPAHPRPTETLMPAPEASINKSAAYDLKRQNPASSSPVSTGLSPKPSLPAVDPLFIESLRQYRNSSPTTIELVRVLTETVEFTRYEIAYLSEGSRVTGRMNVPQAGDQSLEGNRRPWPVILLNHGHYTPETYRPGLGTQPEADYLASHGYVTIASDFRGYGGSEGRPGNHFDPGWTHDVLNLLDALPSLDFVDPERVGIWGHSTGGEMALQIVTSRDSIDAVVLFGSMGANMADNLPLVQREPGNIADRAVERYGLPDDAPQVWAKMSPITYLAETPVPIAIHHGVWDDEVPLALSTSLWQAMLAHGLPGEYFIYPEQRHFFAGQAWSQAMARTLAFFDRHVKGETQGPAL